MLGVAAEDLVGALAGQHHLHRAPRFSRQHEDRDVRGLGDRRVARSDERRQVLDEVARRHHHLVVLGAKFARHQRRMRELGVAIAGEANGERLHLRRVAGHQRDDHARIETAGKEGTEGHVAHHLQLDRLGQFPEERARYIAIRNPPAPRPRQPVRRRPVAYFLELAAVPDGGRGGWQLANGAKQRARARDIPVGEVVPNRRKIDFARDLRHS